MRNKQNEVLWPFISATPRTPRTHMHSRQISIGSVSMHINDKFFLSVFFFFPLQRINLLCFEINTSDCVLSSVLFHRFVGFKCHIVSARNMGFVFNSILLFLFLFFLVIHVEDLCHPTFIYGIELELMQNYA